MANRYFSQFFYSFFKKPVMLAGKATWNTAVASSVIIQDLTYTADTAGEAGDLITIAYVAGGTAGSEAVTVTGNAISVAIDDGVSTATQVKAAVDAEAAAAALVNVTVSGTGGTAQVAVAATSLAGGEDNEWQSLSMKGVSAISVNGAGDYTITFEDNYSKLLGFDMKLLSTTNQDRHAQLDADAVTTGSIGVRLLATTTPTHPADGSIGLFKILLSNSSLD